MTCQGVVGAEFRIRLVLKDILALMDAGFLSPDAEEPGEFEQAVFDAMEAGIQAAKKAEAA